MPAVFAAWVSTVGSPRGTDSFVREGAELTRFGSPESRVRVYGYQDFRTPFGSDTEGLFGVGESVATLY